MTDPILFLIAVATILGTPGPTNTLMATAGATMGIRRALPLLAAELLGYLVSISIIRLVLAGIVRQYPAIGIGLKIAVSLYLVWLAIKLWRSAGPLAASAGPVSFANVLVTTLLNPKGLIFALSIIPLSAPGLAWYFAGFSLLVLTAGGGWITIGAVLNRAAGTRSQVLPRVASVVLIGFAGIILRSAI